jgi:hypothetical protein
MATYNRVSLYSTSDGVSDIKEAKMRVSRVLGAAASNSPERLSKMNHSETKRVSGEHLPLPEEKRTAKKTKYATLPSETALDYKLHRLLDAELGTDADSEDERKRKNMHYLTTMGNFFSLSRSRLRMAYVPIFLQLCRYLVQFELLTRRRALYH